jgi:uncharacterized membrane protein YeiH
LATISQTKNRGSDYDGADAPSGHPGDAVTDIPNIAEDTPFWLLLVTTLVGAIEGAARGRQRGSSVDIMGMLVFALFLGLGGGLARDILLGLPVAAVQTFWYPTMVVVGTLIVLTVGRFLPLRGWTIVVLDALTLALYAIVGTQKALDYNVPPVGAIVIGLFAALTGGVIVSLLQQERPAIITPGAPYALLALAGILIYLALVNVDGALAAIVCIVFVVGARIFTLRRGITTGKVRPLDQ